MILPVKPWFESLGISAAKLSEDLRIADNFAVDACRDVKKLLACRTRDQSEKVLISYLAVGTFEIDQKILVIIEVDIRQIRLPRRSPSDYRSIG